MFVEILSMTSNFRFMLEHRHSAQIMCWCQWKVGLILLVPFAVFMFKCSTVCIRIRWRKHSSMLSLNQRESRIKNALQWPRNNSCMSSGQVFPFFVPLKGRTVPEVRAVLPESHSDWQTAPPRLPPVVWEVPQRFYTLRGRVQYTDLYQYHLKWPGNYWWLTHFCNVILNSQGIYYWLNNLQSKTYLGGNKWQLFAFIPNRSIQ